MKISIRHRYIAKIPALEVTTEEQKNEALPLIVYYHGWQSAKELSLTQARKLAHEGFRVILPDAMNHGERKTGPISTIPSITFWSSIQYNLIEFPVIIHHFHKLGLIKENWIGVGGVSMGGITTSALMEDEKIPYEDMADFEQLVSGKTYARNTQFITEIGERHLVKGETMDLVVDFFKEASKTLEK